MWVVEQQHHTGQQQEADYGQAGPGAGPAATWAHAAAESPHGWANIRGWTCSLLGKRSPRRRAFGLLPPDVDVFTKEGHIQREFAYPARNTVAAFGLGLGALIGFRAGIMAVDQIIDADVSEHLPDSTTLTALGDPFHQVTPNRALFAFTALVVMAIGSAVLCLGRLRDADPAELLRGRTGSPVTAAGRMEACRRSQGGGCPTHPPAPHGA